MTGQTSHSSKLLTILLIAPFAALAALLAIYVSPAAPENGGSLFWEIFIYGLIAVLITGIWSGISHVRWSGWRFIGTFVGLLMVGLLLMGVGRMGTAKATDPAKEDPWIVLSE